MGNKFNVSNGDRAVNDQILIREARPAIEEGFMFARYLDEAAEGFFKSILGRDSYKIIAEAYVKHNSEYSFKNVVFAEYKNEIVGMASGYTYNDKLGFDNKVLSQYSKGTNFHISIFLVIERILSRFLGPKCSEDYYLQSIAVSKEMRGKGIGMKLMESSMDKALKNGSKILSLDVSGKNKNAIQLYKKFGMVLDSCWPNVPLIPSVFTRMVKKIS